MRRAVFLMERSAEEETGVRAVSRLLSGSGSGVLLPAMAVLRMIPAASLETAARTSRRIDAPAARFPAKKTPLKGTQVAPPSADISAPLKSAGSASVKATFSASPGPALEINSVY